MRKNIAIFGATGSIGLQAIDIILQHEDLFYAKILTAHTNSTLLADLAVKTKAQYVVISDESKVEHLKEQLKNRHQCTILAGEKGLCEAAHIECDKVVASIVGVSGLKPLWETCKTGADILLANKEALVVAGNLLFKQIERYQNKIIPIDSEHNAIFQALQGQQKKHIKKITLTASGGPFWSYKIDDMKHITKKQALAHPNWSMGPKISIDSATMANKALEVIEAYYLFFLKAEQISVVIHPQSIIHSLVEFIDHSQIAQLGTSDMRIPISYALAYPSRIENNSESLSLTAIKKLDFYEPDIVRFPFIKIAYDILQNPSETMWIFNCANEVAVAYFLEDKISFMNIMDIVVHMLNHTEAYECSTLDETLHQIIHVKQKTKDYIEKKYCI